MHKNRDLLLSTVFSSIVIDLPKGYVDIRIKHAHILKKFGRNSFFYIYSNCPYEVVYLYKNEYKPVF